MPLLSSQIQYRILEIIPGFLVWMTFVLVIIFSFLKPLWVIYFLILFSLYWIIRLFHFITYLIYSWFKYKKTIKIDWEEKLKEIPAWQNIYHLIIFPTYKESVEILETAFKSLIKINYPSFEKKKKQKKLDKFIVVLAGEERDRENFLKYAGIIKKKFAKYFYKFLITLHPQNLPGEIPCKAANLLWAGKKAKELIDELKIPYENILASPFDMETCVCPFYFSRLTYEYLTHPQGKQRSYQPIIVFHNNIWDSPAFSRLLASAFTFSSLFHLVRPEWLFSACSHSLPFKALVEVNFWDPDIITDDHRIFLKCFKKYRGNYQSIPLHIPVSMDAVYAGSFWQTLVNQYRQQRRWAWGIENFPYIIWNFFIKKEGQKISFLKKFRYLWILSIEMYLWAVTPILILILAFLPMAFIDPETKASLFVQNAPFILDYFRKITLFGLIFSAILGTLLLPKRPINHKPSKYLFMILQWALFPLCAIIFASIPAIEAQTRLMLKRPLVYFQVTEKRRKSSEKKLFSLKCRYSDTFQTGNKCLAKRTVSEINRGKGKEIAP